MDDNTQLQRARELINESQYNEARQILSSMPDNPTAQDWLARLEARISDTPAEAAAPANGDEDKLAQARALIAEKRHAEAAAILRTLPDNPTAQNWLARIESMPANGEGEPPITTVAGGTPKAANAVDPMSYTVPMVPQVADIVQTQLIARLGAVGSVAAIGAVLYGIAAIVDFSYIRGGSTNTFVYAIIATILTALITYGISFGLSLSFPKIPRNTFLIFVGFASGLTFFAALIDSRYVFTFINSSNVLQWILRAALGIGIAYIFATANRFVPAQGEPRLNRNLFILTAIALTMFTAGGYSLILAFVGSLGLGLGNVVGGLLGGLIAGGLLGAILAIALSESTPSVIASSE